MFPNVNREIMRLCPGVTYADDIDNIKKSWKGRSLVCRYEPVSKWRAKWNLHGMSHKLGDI